MDDVLIYGQSQEEHDRNLENVLKIVKQRKIPLNERKCEFDVEEIEFLGYRISNKGIRQTQERIEAIKSLTAPKNKSELQSLLGLINYVTKFIPHLATQTEELRKLVVKDVRFEWNREHDRALEEIKALMSRTDYLGFFDREDIIQVSRMRLK